MHTYIISIQHQATTCKHRCSTTLYVRARNEEDALEYARSLPCPKDYEIRRINVTKEIEVYEVNY